ncbi:MAG: hypothetical protein IT237_10925 [Bacteroidia bacterium]|nr:hypothetical protein [Bacteroidia bacterium]
MFLTQCGPAAEDREMMHKKAKRVSDSIGKVIDDALNEVAIQPSSNTSSATPVDSTKK